MNKASIQAVLFLIATPFLAGCYINLVKPERPIGSPDIIRPSQNNAVQISYRVHAMKSKKPAEKALLDSFSAFGIQNVKESDKPELGRTTLMIYVFESKTAKNERYIGLPWNLISLATLYVVPIRQKQIQPIEIHVLDPAQEYDKQIRIIRTEYVTTTWAWFPFLFMSGQSAGDGAAYGGISAMEKVEHAGWRRIFDAIILEVLKNKDGN